MSNSTPWLNKIIGHGEEDPEQLMASPDNYRIHPKAQQDALLGGISEIGYIRSVTVNKRTGHVVDGHLRVVLALRTGQKSIPVEYVDLSEAEEQEALLLIDPISAMATADREKLDALMHEVQSSDAAVQEMLEDLAKQEGLYVEPQEAPEAQIDKAEELRVKWGTERGQLWLIGKHRLLCGDSTNADDVARLMGEEKAGAVVTDPPYGMKWNADASRFTGGKFGNHPRGRERDDVTNDDRPFDPTPLLGYPVVVLWGMNHFCNMLPSGGVFVWIKKPDDRFDTFLSDCELAWTNSGRGVYAFRHDWGGITRESERGEFLHPTQKPVALMAWCIERSKANGIIYDPYIGSGPILAAAEQLGRICYGMEIEPKYVAVTLQRLADMGLEPSLA